MRAGSAASDVVDEYVRQRPVQALRPFVAWYSGYRQLGVPAGVHRGLPSPYLTLILTLDDPIEMAAHPDPGQAPGRYDSLVGGLHTGPALITNPGFQSGVQLALHPLGALRLLGVPAGELANLDLPVAAVWGPLADRLRALLLGAVTWPERFDVLDRSLLLLLGSGDRRNRREVAPELRYAWQRLRTSAGAVSVADLADETGWSARHLAGRFRTEIGISPKAAARVVRFDRARRMVAQQSLPGRAGRGGLAEVAVACGYFDQAHLTREFRDLAGVSPTAWLAQEFRNVQDVTVDDEEADRHD